MRPAADDIASKPGGIEVSSARALEDTIRRLEDATRDDGDGVDETTRSERDATLDHHAT